MIVIRNKNGEIVSRSANLRGLRRHLTSHPAQSVQIAQYNGGSAYMIVEFQNGDYCRSDWASYRVLCQSLANWRNLRGTPLFIKSGNVGPDNVALL
jgi:hypothetical protein